MGLSDEMAQERVVTEWAVRNPHGYLHTFTDEVIARQVWAEQRGKLLARTVAYSQWTQVLPSVIPAGDADA